MIFHQLTGFLRRHGRISKGALERLSGTNLREISLRIVSTASLSDYFIGNVVF